MLGLIFKAAARVLPKLVSVFGRTAVVAEEAAAVAPAAAKVLPSVAKATASGAAKAGLLSRKLTVGGHLMGLMAIPVAGYAIGQIDKLTGGQLVLAAMNTVEGGIVSAYKNLYADLSPEERRKELSSLINNIDNALGLLTVDLGRTMELTAAVELEQKLKHDTNAGQEAAIAFQLKNPVFLLAKTVLRAKVFNEVHSDLPEAKRNKMLAQGMMDDFLAGTQTAALKKPVTEADIGNALKNHPALYNKLPDGVKDGFKQIFPDLAQSVQAPDLNNVKLVETGHNAIDDAKHTLAAKAGLSGMFASVVGFLTNPISAIIKWVTEAWHNFTHSPSVAKQTNENSIAANDNALLTRDQKEALDRELDRQHAATPT